MGAMDLDLSVVSATDLAIAQAMPLRDRDQMAHRLYRAVLTSTVQSGERGLGYATTGLVYAGDDDAAPRWAKARYVPSRIDLEHWQADIRLLAGYAVPEVDLVDRSPKLERLEQEIERAKAHLARIRQGLADFEAGRIPVAEARRLQVLAQRQSEVRVAEQALVNAVRAVQAEREKGLPRIQQTGRMMLGVLKGAATHWWLGPSGSSVSRWQFAAEWGRVPGPDKRTQCQQAQMIHDRAVLFALVRDQRRRERIARG